jgi:hypothetical protein
MPTVKTIVANKLLPGLVEWRLAQMGYDGQQTDRPLSRDAAGNLFKPASQDEAAHGRFDDEARSRSLQWLGARHRNALLAATSAGIAAAALGLRRGRTR